MRQAKHSRGSSSGPTRRRAKSRRRTESTRTQAGSAMKRGATRAGSIRGLAEETWLGVDAGESPGSSRSRTGSPRSKDVH